MKEIKKGLLEHGESYLVFTGYEWSSSGYDIGTFDKRSGTLDSQANMEDLFEKCPLLKIYELPIN